jgi:hypothetical protein
LTDVDSREGKEMIGMQHRFRKMAMTLAVSGVLVGGGTAIAHAATASPSAKASTSASSSASSSTSANATTDHTCPNDD